MLDSQKQNPEVVRLVPQLPSLEPSGGEVSNSLLKKKKNLTGVSPLPLLQVSRGGSSSPNLEGTVPWSPRANTAARDGRQAEGHHVSRLPVEPKLSCEQR